MLHYSLTHDTLAREIVTHPYIIYDNIFNNEEIDKIINYCEDKELQKGVVNSSDYKSFDAISSKHRNCDLNFHNKNENTSWIFDKLDHHILFINNEFYGFDLNGYDLFQYTVYDSKDAGTYNWHMDTNLGNTHMHQPRKLSLSICLSDCKTEFEGGIFQLNMGNQEFPLDINLEKGSGIFFPSFMCHKVTPVTKGIRKSLVVWVTGPKFI